MRLQAFYISAALRDGFLLLFGAAAFLNIGNQAIVRASKNALAAKAADELAAAKARSAANGSQSRSRNSLVFSRRSSLAERLVVETPAEGNLAICCLSSLWCAHSSSMVSIESIEDGSWMHSVSRPPSSSPHDDQPHA